MKNIKLFLSAIFVFLLFNSCENEDELFIDNPIPDIYERTSDGLITNGATLTFGRYYGKCLGNSCIEIFKLNDDKLWEDVIDRYPSSDSFYEGRFTEFNGSEKIKTEVLFNQLPSELFKYKSDFNTIGEPDAVDAGGIYLEFQSLGVRKLWLIDLSKRNVPKYIAIYVELINNTIDEIGEIDDRN